MKLQLLLLITATAVLPSTRAALILYTAEGDTTLATDQLTADGSQNGTFVNDTVVNTDSKFGSNAYGFDGTTPFDKIDLGISGTSLGSAFTLAAFVKQGDVSTTRLFSNYIGTSSTNGYLIFDFENNYNAGGLGTNEMRFILNNTTIYGNVASDPNYSTTTYYHYAATYDNGSVKLYFNGTEVGTGTAGSGVVSLSNSLVFGEDFAGTAEENIKGSADDILVYNRAMTATEIENLATLGAAAVIPEPASMLLVGLAGLAAVFALRRRA